MKDFEVITIEELNKLKKQNEIMKEAMELHKSIWHGCLTYCLSECSYVCKALNEVEALEMSQEEFERECNRMEKCL